VTRVLAAIYNNTAAIPPADRDQHRDTIAWIS
jgi:hypothetical protein